MKEWRSERKNEKRWSRDADDRIKHVFEEQEEIGIKNGNKKNQ